MTTLQEALSRAQTYWEAKGASSRMLPIRARRCAALLKADLSRPPATDPATGTQLLTALATDGLCKSSQGSYYAAYRRALSLSGIPTFGWPKGPSAPRRVRDHLTGEDLDRLAAYFIAKGEPETRDLLEVLRGTGMRVEVEALDWDAARLQFANCLTITGKGGHERVVPTNHNTSALLLHSDRMAAMRRLSYSAHLKRWNAAVKALGITSRRPTPHAVRHHYATEAYRKSGRNLRAVQELLGHADPATTARYIGVDMAELREAVG
jgi:site-specific recombinase XerD